MIYIYIIVKTWWVIREKSPEKTENKPRLVSLFYDVESRLFYDLQSRPKTSRAILKGEGA